MRRRIRIVALVVALSGVLMLSIAYYWPVQEPYHSLNYGWNGCSKIADTTQNTTLIFSYDKIPPERALLAIIGPGTEFSKSEGLAIQRFLESGGTVLLADDFGTGNGLLQRLGVAARFSGKPLADLLYYDRQWSFPLITDFSPSQVTTNITTIIMDSPSYIELGNSSQLTVLAMSSTFSFIDMNRGNQPAVNTTLNSYPVIASVSVAKGILVMISDPGIFVNEIVDLYDNMRLFRNLLAIGEGSLFLDVAHLSKAPLTDARIDFINAVDSIRNFLLYSMLGAFVQSAVTIAIILTLSIEILRKTRRGQETRQR